jgi:hypothetical protein
MDIVVKDRIFDSGNSDNNDRNQPLIELASSIDDVVGICLVSANVPFTYYVFDSTNNTFVITVSGTPYTITIPPQTVNIAELPLVFASAFSAVSNSTNFQFYVDNTTSQLVIYNTAAASFSLDFTASTAAYDFLGFAATTYSSATVLSLGGIYDNSGIALTSTYTAIVSPFAVNMSGEPQMFLHDRFVGPALNGSIANDTNSADIIGEFRVNTNYQGYITYENPAPVMYQTQIASVKKLHLYLTVGNRTTPLDLEGAKFQIKLRFFCRKKQVDSHGADQFGNANVASVTGGGSVQLRRDVGRGAVFRR